MAIFQHNRQGDSRGHQKPHKTGYQQNPVAKKIVADHKDRCLPGGEAAVARARIQEVHARVSPEEAHTMGQRNRLDHGGINKK